MIQSEIILYAADTLENVFDILRVNVFSWWLRVFVEDLLVLLLMASDSVENAQIDTRDVNFLNYETVTKK